MYIIYYNNILKEILQVILKFPSIRIWIESHNCMFLKLSLKIKSLSKLRQNRSKSHVTNDNLQRLICLESSEKYGTSWAIARTQCTSVLLSFLGEYVRRNLGLLLSPPKSRSKDVSERKATWCYNPECGVGVAWGKKNRGLALGVGMGQSWKEC